MKMLTVTTNQRADTPPAGLTPTMEKLMIYLERIFEPLDRWTTYLVPPSLPNLIFHPPPCPKESPHERTK